MIEPALPEGESKRISALERTRLLDSEPEKRFDRYVNLAAKLFDVPIALISLVDNHRQWFKSKAGLDAEETSRAVSFCGHAILDNEIFLVNDARRDNRFDDNPLVVDAPNVIFYAGQPVRAVGGEPVGTLCLIDHEPREFDAVEADLLRQFGKLVSAEISRKLSVMHDKETNITNRFGIELLSRLSFALCDHKGINVVLTLFELTPGSQAENNFHIDSETSGRFAEFLDNAVPNGDLIARIGKRLFVGMFVDAEIDTVKKLGSDVAKQAASMLPTSVSVRMSFTERKSGSGQEFSVLLDSALKGLNESVGIREAS
ncbi:MAG: GAF domain-containing protein [Pseudomonadota bacterium]